MVQRDRAVLLDLHAPGAEEARIGLSRFAELVKSPEHLHTYKITALSLWNAGFAGMRPEDVFEFLEEHSLTGVPREVRAFTEEMMSRTGRIRLLREGEDLVLQADRDVAEELRGLQSVAELLQDRGDGTWLVPPGNRGLIKKALVKVGYPI
jgi:DNA excision repair protein ERCC-3